MTLGGGAGINGKLEGGWLGVLCGYAEDAGWVVVVEVADVEGREEERVREWERE